MLESSPSSAALVVSIVSHGHGAQVQRLLYDLARLSATSVRRVVLTLNQPEAPPQPPPQGWPFLLQIVTNELPVGFGANHNRALHGATEPLCCILNPDVALEEGDPMARLVALALAPGVGCAYPIQRDEQGRVQDSERAVPTPLALWRRRVLRQPDTRVEWVNAAFLMIPRPVWEAVGGFDERYFMYCEDVDLSLRIRLGGWALARANVSVVHAGQRASHRQWRHLRWHVASLLRLWSSPVYRKARQLLPAQVAGTDTIGPS